MSGNSLYKSYKITLTPITPTVIGDGEEISQAEYYSKGERVFIVDFVKYIEDNPSELNKFIQRMKSAGTRKFSIDRDMSGIKDNKKYVRYSVPKQPKVNVSHKIKTFVKDSNKMPYVPGSSIKGAIRTAIAYSVLKNNPNWFNKHKGLLRKRIPKRKNLIDEIVFRQGKNDAKFDLLRLLEVTDSPPFPPEKLLSIYEVKIVSGARNDRRKGSSFGVFVEAWDVNKSVESEIVIASGRLLRDILEKIELSNKKNVLSIEYIISALNQFAEENLEYDKKVIEELPQKPQELESLLSWNEKFLQDVKKSPKNTAYISLGQGQGWHRITDGILLQKTDFFKIFIRNNFSRGRTIPFPKSRHLTEHEGRTVPLGWVKIEFLEDGEIERNVHLPEIRVEKKVKKERTFTKAEQEIATEEVKPKFKLSMPEREPTTTSERKKENKMKRLRFLGEIKNESLRSLIEELIDSIAQLIWVKDIIADFSRQSADPRCKVSDIEFGSDVRMIDVTISDGKSAVKVKVETCAKSEEERNFVANKIWGILKKARV